MFNSLSDRLAATFKTLRGKGRLSPADVDATIREIRRALLDADVAVPVVRQFTAAVRERALDEDINKALNPSQQVVRIVYDELVEVLGGETTGLDLATRPPTVILLAGLQGSGKTTLAGKLGLWLREQGKKPLLVAADLQRPGAVQQLRIVGGQAGVDVFAPEPGDGIGDPVAVASAGLRHAQDQYYDTLVVDTAGRLGVDDGLMKQAAQIRDAVQPDDVLFVIDSMIGQDAVTTAEAFKAGVGFTGVVLTKLDGDARGGAALSVRSVTGVPILFASTGEKLSDFEVFHPDRMASRILDLGDILTLIEQAQRVFDEDQAKALERKIKGEGDDFTLEDFLAQLQQVRQMGSIKKLIGMMPGAGQMRDALDQFDEREIDRVEAIVRSMTPAERTDPKIINGSRRARIARGSGNTVQAVNQLLQRFDQAKTMMRSVARGGRPQIGGGGKKSKGRMAAPARRSKKSRSGNPAKRAAEEKAWAEQASQPAASAAPQRGAAFGLGGGGQASPGPGQEPGQDVEPGPGQIPTGLGGLFGPR
ncbi:MAG: signal recognition particle protein [Bifidobacteriaceae bacterium]|jgi:signal recognition particle subunit SRP54|nr:signal recognition particle protein [Bifidobacteriaceae bacterium]